jgi:predicted small lipoprotein YifL
LDTNKARRNPLALLVVIILLASLAACGVVGITPPPTTSSPSPAGATQPGSAPTATVLPATSGTSFKIEGVLEVEGSLPSLRFFLRTEEGTRIEVLPWLPTEVMQPPAGQSAPPTMADWIGQKIELRGNWVQSESDLVFQVISAERADN